MLPTLCMLGCLLAVLIMQAHAPMRHEPLHEEDDQSQQQCPDEALFKTRMCVYFQQGRCQRGTACTFAHDPAELQAYNPARRYAQQVLLLLPSCCLLIPPSVSRSLQTYTGTLRLR